METLLIIGGIVFLAYVVSQGNKSNLALGNTSNIFTQNTLARTPIIPGEQTSPSLQTLTVSPALAPIPNSAQPPAAPVPIVATPVSSGLLPVSGSTSLSTLVGDAGPIRIGAEPVEFIRSINPTERFV